MHTMNIFAQAGANLVLLDIDTEKLNVLEKELSIGPRCRKMV